MHKTNVFIPLNHYKNDSSIYHEQTGIQIISSERLNNFFKIDKTKREEFDFKDYIKLISDNEINRFFSYQKRKYYFSQPYLCIPIKYIDEISNDEIVLITNAIFAFLRLFDSLFGKDNNKYWNFESWGEWCSTPGSYNTICIYQNNTKAYFYDLFIEKPSLRLKENVFLEDSNIFKYLNVLPKLVKQDNFLAHLLCSYNKLYSLVIEENFNDFLLLGISILENIFPNKNLEKSENLSKQVSDSILLKTVDKTQIYDAIKYLYKQRNTLVHYYYAPRNPTEFYSKTYEFRAIDVFNHHSFSKSKEKLLLRIIENYTMNYIKENFNKIKHLTKSKKTML